ncbi:MAG: hypothetical protein KKD44_21635 [Proteobacteria bacterium]|nr:hypothetical protein [Pseudomonadota bacterium]
MDKKTEQFILEYSNIIINYACQYILEHILEHVLLFTAHQGITPGFYIVS